MLTDGSYLRLWLTGAITATVRWLEVLGIGIYTLAVTDSPLYVALMLFARTLPGVFFGVLTGMIASRYNRKFLLCGGLLVLIFCAGLLTTLSLLGWLQLWHIALGAVISGIVWTMEHPVRRTLLGDVAGLSRLKAAMSLDQVTFNMTRALGPMLGGGVYMFMGMTGVYVCTAVAFSVALALVAGVRYADVDKSPRHTSFWRNLTEGYRYVAAQPILRAVLLITLVANFFGFSYATLVPVVGASILSLDPGSIGLMQSMEGVGATLGALVLAMSATSFNYGRMFSFGAVLFMVGVLAFAIADSFVFACLGLLLAGPGLAAFGAMQSTILLHYSEPQERERVMGVLVVCIGAGPIGVLFVGVLADFIGPVATLVAMCCAGLLSLGLILLRSKELLSNARPA